MAREDAEKICRRLNGEAGARSATASQLGAEQERQRQREEIARRMAKPLKGGGAVNLQPQFDLGQTGQMDLFAPIAEATA